VTIPPADLQDSIASTVLRPASVLFVLTLLPATVPAQSTEAVFVDVALIPLDRDRAVQHQSVRIRNGRIAAIGPVAELPVSDSALRIDGRGKYLMPGLADMHVHLFNSKDLLLYLANGVTTIRNLGGYGAADSILEIRGQVRAGERLGPTIYTSGNWLDGDPPYRSINTVVRTPTEARAEVERQARAGYDFIKVYVTLAPDVYREITSTARANGIPVTGHVPSRVGLARVLESGQVAVDHVAQLTGGSDPGRVAARLSSAKVSVTTTLVMLRLSLSMRGAPERMEGLLARPEARLVSPATRRFWREAPFVGLPRTDAALERYPESQEMVRALERAGASLLLGTDAGLWGNLPGFSALEEARLLVESGLTPYQALRTATVEPADVLNRHVRGASQPGAIRVGNRADLVLLEGNPLVDIANLRRQAGVMVRGKWLPASELDRLLRALEAEYAAETGT
jgi:imidazolonepropionase-like amidohydrolase